MNNDFSFKVADTFFFVFHIVLIFFNLFGWMLPRLRKWNLITLLLTAFSWLGLGIFYGFGYCFLTDWHWDVRERLGETTDSDSYIHFLVTELTPLEVSEHTIDLLTAVFFFAAVSMSIIVNWRTRRRKRTPAA